MRFLLLIAFLLVACDGGRPAVRATIDTLPGDVVRVTNPGPSGWNDSARVTFTEIQRIQPPEDSPDALGDIWDLTVSPDGRIFATQLGPLRVVEFDTAGRLTRTLGREGAGPGEYQAAVLAFARGKLFIQDPQQRRGTTYDSSGALAATFPTTCCIWRQIGSDTAGRVYVPIMPQTPGQELEGHGWVRYAIDGTPGDTIWRRDWGTAQKMWEFSPGPGSRSRFVIPYQPGPIDVPWPGGGLLVGDNGSYSITIAPRGNDSLRVFGRSWTPLPVPDAQRQAFFDRMTSRNASLKSVARLEDIPVTAPAFDALLVDAELRIWVKLTVPADSTGTTFDIFRPDGVWLGTARAPFRARTMAFRPGELVVATSDENELPVIVRYAIGGLDPIP